MRYLVIAAMAVTLFFSSAGHAASFWLLGSYDAKDAALEEARRISRSLGLESYLQSSGGKHRVLLALKADGSALRDQLAELGIKDVYTVSYTNRTPAMQRIFVAQPSEPQSVEPDAQSGTDAAITVATSEFNVTMDDAPGGDLTASELAEIDAMLADYDDEPGLFPDVVQAGNYLVVGSFSSRVKAESLIESVNTGSYGTAVQASDVDGTVYYRALVGPVASDSEAEVKAELEAQGIRGVWVLRNVQATQTEPDDFGLDIPGQRGLKIPGNPDQSHRTFPGDDSDYNLARLKKE